MGPKITVMQFNNFNSKARILWNCKKMKGTRLSIYEDYSKETLAIRKEKWKEVVAIDELGLTGLNQAQNEVFTIFLSLDH